MIPAGIRAAPRRRLFRFGNRPTKLSVAPPSYTGRVRTRCLSFHAAYRCRHSGECCRAGWDVEVEPHIVEAVQMRRIVPMVATSPPFEPLPDGGALAPTRTRSGDCGFHHDDRCSLQSAGSEAMLPSACRHFPRVYLRDARGCLLTLSHFCPTAASLLLDAGTVSIVDAPPPLALDEPIEGLDARQALPPLVRPGMLADVGGYAAWEEAVVRALLESECAGRGLARIERATETVRRWSPGAGALADHVADAFAVVGSAEADPGLSRGFSIVRELTGPHPLMEVPADFERIWTRLRTGGASVMRAPVSRYLAATAFANWIAYRGEGLRSIVAWLRACHDVLRVQLVRRLDGADGIDPQQLVEAIRMTDYIVVHTVDSLAFGRAAAALER